MINTEKFIKRKKEKTSTLIGFDRRNSKRKSTTKVQSNFSLAAIPAGEHTPNIISYDSKFLKLSQIFMFLMHISGSFLIFVSQNNNKIIIFGNKV